MRCRTLALCALSAPAAALVHHQYNSVPDGPMRTQATATTTTIAPPPASFVASLAVGAAGSLLATSASPFVYA